jgi:hypothetical protein
MFFILFFYLRLAHLLWNIHNFWEEVLIPALIQITVLYLHPKVTMNIINQHKGMKIIDIQLLHTHFYIQAGSIEFIS